MVMNLLLTKTDTLGRKIKCINTRTGRPAPKVFIMIPQGIPWAYCLAEIPPIKSVEPERIGPKKSNDQYAKIIHISLFHWREENSLVKENPLFFNQTIGNIV